jgi:hypothetical protein
MNAAAPNTISCHGCGNRTRPIEHRAPFCIECWKVVPYQMQTAYQNGTIPIRQMAEAIRLRRASYKLVKR